MSRVDMAIKSIKEDLDSISGLDGIVADLVEHKATEVKLMVEFIKQFHPNANLFDYYGEPSEEVVE